MDWPGVVALCLISFVGGFLFAVALSSYLGIRDGEAVGKRSDRSQTIFQDEVL